MTTQEQPPPGPDSNPELAVALDELYADLDALLADLPPLLDRKQLCNLLQVNRLTLESWMRTKGFPLPLICTEHTRRWNKISVRRWLIGNSQEVASCVS
jgi:hypothetical protein